MSEARTSNVVPEMSADQLRAAGALVASELKTARAALRFIKELSGECLDNGDVRVGTAAEVAMRHIWRRADETL